MQSNNYNTNITRNQWPQNKGEPINLNYADPKEIQNYLIDANKKYQSDSSSDTSTVSFGPVPPVKSKGPSSPEEAFKNIMARGYRQAESGTILISPYLEKNMSLWVWDFDDTLIDTRAYKRHNMDPEIIRNHLSDAELTADIPNWGYFKKLVQYLVATGKRVGIASFGTYSIIKAYMDRIFGPSQKYFGPNNLLATCPEIGCNRSCIDMPLNKNAYILKIMKFYRIQGYEAVVLFDDSSSNIADALRIGIAAFQIDEVSGLFGAQIMFMIEAKIQDKCETELCGPSTFGSLGDRKRWKYDMQAYDDIFNRVLKPSRVDPSANRTQGSTTTTTSTSPATTDIMTTTTTSTNSETTTTIGNVTEGFETGKKDKQDTCVTCRAGHELWVIGIIMALVIGIIIWAIIG
jgi:hypothetical protein